MKHSEYLFCWKSLFVYILSGFVHFGLFGTPVFAKVDPSFIEAQKAQTRIFKLKNGTPVLLRQIPDSSLFELGVFFAKGLSSYSSRTNQLLT